MTYLYLIANGRNRRLNLVILSKPLFKAGIATNRTSCRLFVEWKLLDSELLGKRANEGICLTVGIVFDSDECRLCPADIGAEAKG